MLLSTPEGKENIVTPLLHLGVCHCHVLVEFSDASFRKKKKLYIARFHGFRSINVRKYVCR